MFYFSYVSKFLVLPFLEGKKILFFENEPLLREIFLHLVTHPNLVSLSQKLEPKKQLFKENRKKNGLFYGQAYRKGWPLLPPPLRSGCLDFQK